METDDDDGEFDWVCSPVDEHHARRVWLPFCFISLRGLLHLTRSRNPRVYRSQVESDEGVRRCWSRFSIVCMPLFEHRRSVTAIESFLSPALVLFL